MTENELFEHVQSVFVSTFELDPSVVTREANLFTDLDLDSIDALDLIVQLEQSLGSRPSEEDLRQLRTVGDVVEMVARYKAGVEQRKAVGA